MNMRSNVKRLFSLLLAAVLVFSLSLAAFAADGESLLTLKPTADSVIHGNAVTVAVDATAAGVVADGKLTFSYDSTLLSFAGVQAGTAWPETADLSLQANGGKLGTVVVAFAGVEAAQAGTIFTLNFTAVEKGQSTVSQDGGYISGVNGYTLTAQCQVSGQCPASQFTDVDLDAYYHESVDFVVGNGYMIGVGNGLFAPNNDMTRAMLVMLLYRLAGNPEVSGTVPFTDVQEGHYFYTALVWAYESGIAKGMTEELFVPNRPVTREQMATFFARYAGYCGMTTETEGDLAGFVDAGEVSGYAVESMTWAVEAGLIEGVSSEEPTLRPKGSSTRAQVAAVVMRFAALGQS